MSSNKDKTKILLLTGSTGAFGKFLALELIKYEDVKLILPVRGKSQEESKTRILNVIGGKYEKKVEVFRADLTKEYFGLSRKDYMSLANRVTHILHSAASIQFTLPLEEARLYNVKTTESIIDFAKKCPRLVRFGFLSTALVAGKKSGVIKEDEFEHQMGFKNTYEQTKYEAEKLVRESIKQLPVVIFRPPLIIAPRPSKNSNGPINLLSLAISLIVKGHLSYIPGTEKSTVDFVHAIHAARVIVSLLFKEHLSYLTYHITNGDRAITVEVIRSILEQKYGKRIPLKFCGSMESFLQYVHQIPWYNYKAKVAYKRCASFLPEAAYPKIFDNSNTLAELRIKEIGGNPRDTIRLII